MSRTISVAAILLGIAGVALWPIWYASLVLGILALVAGWTARQTPVTRAVGTVGMWLGGCAVAVGALVLLLLTPVSTEVEVSGDGTGSESTVNDIGIPTAEVVVFLVSVLLIVAVAAWLILRARRRRITRQPLLPTP